MKFYVKVKEEDLEKINSDFNLNAGQLKNSQKRPKNAQKLHFENFKIHKLWIIMQLKVYRVGFDQWKLLLILQQSFQWLAFLYSWWETRFRLFFESKKKFPKDF